ncbi:cytochrome P450 [Sistotremastrum suecicum HHB10207 ss-3]|uniref:Cytochrome P450 n=1 Tax=Sistotremastrum suecicum HHB10207 ss-3 TaxID=1314776 RepID=A0A166CAJ8_9AGAM|nr:cytochrome P450 [Sistotremastrum suecicum HHB10207 ss-3]
MSPSFPNLLVVGCVLSLLLLWKKSRELSLPPGPRNWPWHYSPPVKSTQKSWIRYAEWKKVYGPVASYTRRKSFIIVINTAKAAVDLLEKRSRIYSDRPASVMVGELMEFDRSFFRLSISNPRFQIYRKLFHQELGPQAVKAHISTLERETRTYLRNLLREPANFRKHIKRFSSSIVIKIAFGYSVVSENDHFVGLVNAWFDHANSQLATAGQWMVDSYPFLKHLPRWLPGAAFLRFADEERKKHRELLSAPLNWVKTQIAEGKEIPSFASRRLSRPQRSPEDDDITKYVAASIYFGGGDTNAAALITFILLMVLHPEIQQRAREELDRVVGTDRLPNIDDAENLPYVNALIKEVLRFHPVAPLAVPHRVTEDDEYDGMRIPKGSTIVVNIWSILHDESVYPNHMKFDPERHLSNLTKSQAGPQPDPRNYVFGFGRRVCPGIHLAEVALFLAISSTLAVFEISKATDKDGNLITPRVAFAEGIVSFANAFDCAITPRSLAVMDLLNLGED